MSTPTQFVTLSRSDSKFKSYIYGTFSKELRAIPAKNLNVNTVSELVTFKIVAKKDVARPGIPVLLWHIFRGPMSLMVLTPSIALLGLFNFSDVSYSSTLFVFAVVASWLLQMSVFFYNDFVDYAVGSDRMNSNEGSKYLQMGWVSPIHILRMAQIFLTVGVLLGAVLVFQKPSTLVVISIAAAVGIFGYSFPNVGFKRLGLAELTVFWCFGPLVTLGLHQLLVNATVVDDLLLKSFLVGVLFGHANVMVVQFRQLESSMSDALVKVKTFAVRLGFDKTKAFLMLQLLGHAAVVVAINLALKTTALVHVVNAFYILGLLVIFSKLKAIPSPAGSRLQGLSNQLSVYSFLYASLYFFVSQYA